MDEPRSNNSNNAKTAKTRNNWSVFVIAFSWFLSLLVNLGMAAAMYYAMTQPVDLRKITPQKLLEVEIVEPKPKAVPLPTAKPKAPKPEAQPPSKALPVPTPEMFSNPLAKAPEPGQPKASPKISPKAQGVKKLISEKKEGKGAESYGSTKGTREAELKAFAESGGIVNVESDGYKHGAEMRFGHAVGFYSYPTEDFVGHYKDPKSGRVVAVIDARETPYGKLLLYDSQSGLFRPLTKFGKYIYTYGPSFYEDKPVEGSVVFLADGDHISRIIWQPKEPPAVFPVKIRFSEENISFESQGQEHAGTIIIPPGEKVFPAVVWLHGNGCEAPEMAKGFARLLALHNVATMIFSPKGCADGTRPGAGALAEIALDAVRFLKGRDDIDAKKVGIWSSGAAIEAGMLAAAQRRGPSFLICSDDSEEAFSPDAPSSKAFGKVRAPALWILSGPDPRAFWGAYASAVKRAGDDFSVKLLQTEMPKEKGKDKTVGVLENFSHGYSKAAIPWIFKQ